jgi:hypothetical protein
MPLIAVLWIRIGFNLEPGPAFHVNADPDPVPDPRWRNCENFTATKNPFL